ncbi:glycosyltransferase [Paeniglutamicibacter terrestris]|uniref:D-inositol 3-phosphate glycosyltransferase n=1 Tax=Paeniglutamicibacter terrestris TaxID=2723403 RepID=A0ABX1G135_9MICC|nr:glycosyltransferase [Paeniglutamicibacter terrestris]NKG19953.1 glycosyltransferase [Paeniglutamicibacter terrestris]
MRIQSCLDAIKKADRLVDALRLADELAVEAGRDGGVRNLRLLRSTISGPDQVTAIAAIHALAQVSDEEADQHLAELLSSDQGFIREHAAWAHDSRTPRSKSVGRLIGLVHTGGFAGMLAQRTLEDWAATVPEMITVGLEGALLGVTDEAGRYRLAETLGLVGHETAILLLERIARDTHEAETIRVAAVIALGQHPCSEDTKTYLEAIAEENDLLGQAARLTLADLASSLTPRPAPGAPGQGLTIAQLFLHADIDADLSHAGSGDTGGIATLLVRLGDALVHGHGDNPTAGTAGPEADRSSTVSRVVTLSRGGLDEAVRSLDALRQTATGHVYGRVPLLQGPMPSATAWPLRVAARRGIHRILSSMGRVDALHLRMADVGSLAAFDVARNLEIPVVFTVAPDPHAVINSMDLSGQLTRENFGNIDEVEHFWFRARLVQRMAATAAHTVFFPRPELAQDMKELVGLDMSLEPERHTVIPEGIDLQVVDRAVNEAQEHAAGHPATEPLVQLRELLARLPAERRGKPLLISVGRFHRVKGMATIVEAWAGSELQQRANLLLVGGNLRHPSPDELEQLERINALIDPGSREPSGLILSGHQPNDTVARWVAAARTGVPGLAAGSGVYVCGSLKEEFGIALLEAMASGLLVVAPDSGGPATYLEHGHTGFLTATWDTARLRAAILEALESAAVEISQERALYSRSVVEADYTVQAMARALAKVYSDVHHADVELQRELVSAP